LTASDPDKREPDMALIGAYVRSRDFDKALAAAETLIRKAPSSPVAYNAKGVVLLAKGDLKGARPAFEKALATDPAFTTAQYNLARLDALERNFAAAKKRYDELLAKDPKAERALMGIAETLVANDAPTAEVAAALQRAVTANPDSVAPRLALVSHLGRQKDWKAALAAAQAAQAAIPDTPQVLEALAVTQQASGELNQAIESYTRLARFQPDNPLPLMRIAGIQAGLKNPAAAVASLKSALAVAPDNSTIWIALAAAYREANQVDAGFADARRLQKDQPKAAAGFALEAELLAGQKQYAEAATAYRAALARQQLPFSVIRQHALLVLLGKGDEAQGVAQKWLKDHPKDVPVRAYLAQENLAKGDFKAAVPLFRAAVDNDPDNVVLLNNLAWSMSEINDPKALQYAERAYRIAPNVSEVANTYGWILVERGDAVQGIKLLRRAVEMSPTDAEKRLRLGKALAKTGDKTGARQEFELAMKSESPTTRAQAEQLLKTL
ncbi:MAG: XrtA/PEP-CTERM system TPR-repeat protein PrsT, partial [Casimicrobiaceae bacterium]